MSQANIHLVVENGECSIKELVARSVVDGPWSLRGERECRVLNPTQGVATGDELTRIQHLKYDPKLGTDLDHLEWREALPSEISRVLCQGVLRLGHSRRSGLRGVDPTAAESNIVAPTRDVGKHPR
jgi:hypothetical protein